MVLAKILESSMQSVPGCVFAGYVDLEMGMMLAASPADHFSRDDADTLAVAVLNLFEGRHVIQIEDQFREATGAGISESSYFQEIVVVCDETVHVMHRSQDRASHVVCYVCTKGGDPMEMLTAARGERGAFAGIFNEG